VMTYERVGHITVSAHSVHHFAIGHTRNAGNAMVMNFNTTIFVCPNS